MPKVTVKDWIEMFRELGLNEAQMQQWHRLFENRHPQGHQEFLQWLGLPAQKIEEIRTQSK